MVTNSKVYILHEYGAPSHYNALVELGKQNGFSIIFLIFSPTGLIKAFKEKKFKIVIKSIEFLLSLPFRKKSTIVLGIAPYNGLIIPLYYLLKRHLIYYHTSYTCWSGINMAYPTNSRFLKNLWKKFISKSICIFAVSNKTKNELIQNGYAPINKISTVYHSLNTIVHNQPHDKENSFIYVGRLVKSKGIEEVLSIFAQKTEARLTIVGSGPLESLVKKYTEIHTNISYLGYIDNLQKLIPLYQNSSFIIMNSKRSNGWEELFGISIIEGMICGCVPITTDHPGPKEIITQDVNGIITKENDIKKGIEKALTMTNKEYQVLRNRAIMRGQEFHVSNIAKYWKSILE